MAYKELRVTNDDFTKFLEYYYKHQEDEGVFDPEIKFENVLTLIDNLHKFDELYQEFKRKKELGSEQSITQEVIEQT